jgi:hypothetical protein
MGRLALLALLGLLIGAQEPPPLPAGQFCVHASVRDPRPAHPCACKRHCTDPNDPASVNHDPVCKQYCSEGHCHCLVTGCN